MRKYGFTLVEVIIVVTILGIMAAIVMPTFQGNVAKAKESASKSNLSTMRSQIELYRIHHNGVPPGYVNGSGSDIATLQLQFTGTTTTAGLASPSTIPSDPFLYGPYLKKIPQNPYNKLATITYVADATEFSVAANGTSSGWLYKKETGEIMLNWNGVDSKGIAYSNYGRPVIWVKWRQTEVGVCGVTAGANTWFRTEGQKEPNESQSLGGVGTNIMSSY